MAYTITKGTTFEYATYTGSTIGTYSAVAGLQTLPDLGGDAELVDVTTLANANRCYVPGVRDLGTLEYGFVYETGSSGTNFRTLKALESAPKVGIRITLPDSTKFTYDAAINVKLNGAGVNDAIAFTCATIVQSDITMA